MFTRCCRPGSVFIKQLKSNVYVSLTSIGSFWCYFYSHWLSKQITFLYKYGPTPCQWKEHNFISLWMRSNGDVTNLWTVHVEIPGPVLRDRPQTLCSKTARAGTALSGCLLYIGLSIPIAVFSLKIKQSVLIYLKVGVFITILNEFNNCCNL